MNPPRTRLATAFAGLLCVSAASLAQTPTAAPQTAPAAPAAAPAVAKAVDTKQTETKPDGAPSDALIGKPPPAIKVAKWVKGEPLTGFEKGKVYVVDFWATWCGPCKAAIPHLSELAQKNKGKVEVVGISINERQKSAEDTSYIEAVEKFVAKQDDRMDYRVAVDTPDKVMYTTWQKPAGTGGIPTAWIIDQKGLVAWIGIGSPKTVERIVNEVLAGTFDISKEKERQKAEEAEARKRSAEDIAKSKDAAGKADSVYAKYPGYQEAMKRGDHAAALESLNAAFKADPASEASGAYQWKFMILLQNGKPEPVNAYARELLDKFPKNDDIAGFVSAVIVTASDDEPKFDKAIALEAAKRSMEGAKPDSRWQQFAAWRLGWAYYHTGDREKAIASMQTALDGVKRLKGKIDFGELETECEEAMKVFEKGAKQ